MSALRYGQRFALTNGSARRLMVSSAQPFTAFPLVIAGDSIIANSTSGHNYLTAHTADGEIHQLLTRFPFTRFETWSRLLGPSHPNGTCGGNVGHSGSAPGATWQPGGTDYASLIGTGPKVVFLALGVNAYLSSGPQVWSELAPSISALVAAGVGVVVGTVRPWCATCTRSTDLGAQPNANGNTPTEQNVMDINALIRANASGLGTVAAPVVVADLWLGWMDALGFSGEVTTYRHGLGIDYNDGLLHPNKAGAYHSLNRLLGAFSGLGFGVSQNYCEAVLFSRANLCGAAGTFTVPIGGSLGSGLHGSAPLGTSISANTLLASPVFVSCVGGALSIQVTTSGASTFESVLISIPSVAAGVPGQWISTAAKIRKADMFKAWTRTELLLQQTSAYNGSAYYWTSGGFPISAGTVNEGLLPAAVETLYVQSPPILANGAAGSLTLEVGWSPGATAPGTSGTIFIDRIWAGAHDDPSTFYRGN